MTPQGEYITDTKTGETRRANFLKEIPMKRILPIILLAAFSSKKPVPVEQVISPQEKVDALLAIDPTKFPETPHWAVPEYDQIILETLKLLPVKMPCDPITTIKGMVQAESSFKKNSMYLESFGVYSIGLMQLSVEDEKRYHCGFKTQADVKHPIRNLYCTIKIMNKLQTLYPNENFFEAQGRYWSTARWDRYAKWKGKSQGGVKRVLAYWKSNGCNVD
jgi:hypothetical protein